MLLLSLKSIFSSITDTNGVREINSFDIYLKFTKSMPMNKNNKIKILPQSYRNRSGLREVSKLP